MSKSRYSKTKAAGELVGLSRYGKQFGQTGAMRKPPDAANEKKKMKGDRIPGRERCIGFLLKK